ncbi:MAG TPA: PVC-type heme-binding CxxCH protein [Vicinamibacterales bacterium]|nr:PVC-type heme-binding CxxCH protein [Vicinamibacterales bacterium]
MQAVRRSLNRSVSSVIALLVAGLVMTGYAYQTGKPWPPGVQQVSDESPVLSPEEEMKTFFLPPGYRVELVASEPMVEEPILIDWDADGRLWVIEQRGYMQDLPATNEREPLGRVSVLEDTNNDGKMDKKTVFMDGLVLPRALKVLDRGVLIGEPPHLWLARDTNGDLKADSKELVVDTYGQELGNIEHNANSLTWALDNWMYTSEHNGYLRLKDGKFDYQPTLARGQWGATQDDAGRIYRNTNEAALFVDLLPARYFTRNPNLVRTRGLYESLQNEEVNRVWPVRPTRAVNRGYQDGILRPDGTLAHFTAVCAPTVYRGDRLPAELYGNVFVAEPAANLVSRIIVSDDGTTLRSKKAYADAEFLASTDERFRPVYLSSAPDGTLYVVDTYHGIIQHKGFITEYLRDQILSRKLDRPSGHGRIFRIVHDTTQRDRTPALSKATPAQLVDTLSHPNGWWRDTAQRLLVERGDRSIVKALTDKAERASDWRTRLHALWTLDGLDAIEPATVTHALDDSSRDVRVSALQLSERWLAQPNHPIQTAVLKRTADADWAVRRQLAATLGVFPANSAGETALITMLERSGDDPILVDAALTGLAGREPAVLQRLLETPAETPQKTAVVTTLAATIVKGGQDKAVQDLLHSIAEESRPAWQRRAVVAGAEAVLAGAALPGAPPGRGGGGAAAPNSTAAGARGGPGGARAFPDDPGTASGGGSGRGAGGGRGGRGSGGPSLALSREPAEFTALAKGNGDLSTRASTLLARMNWPGKPPAAGAQAPVAPLTPEQQTIYDAGQTVFKSLCMACHGEEGKGGELGPALIGSQFALAAPEIPIRILLQGKEGKVGLMPPLGATLTDAQIAGALTYIRRQWGNAAGAVDPSTVKDVRTATVGRTRPWTNDELTALAAGRGGQGAR